MYRHLLPVLLALALPAFAADIRVGAVIDQSGHTAEAARDYLAGARTWFDHVNAQGGIRGRKLVLVTRDDEGQPAHTLRLTRELLGERVDLLFGLAGDEGIRLVATDTQFRQSRATLFAPLSGAAIGAPGDALVFVRPTYQDEVRHIIQHFGVLKLTRFAVVHAPGQAGLADAVDGELAARGLAAAGRFALRPGVNPAEAILKSQPQVIVVAADTLAMAEVAKAIRARDTGVNLVGLSTVNHRVLMELAKADVAAGTLITQVVPNPMVSATRLQSEHLQLMARYRDEPPSHLTLEGFVAAKALVKALERIPGDITRASIAQALGGTRRLELDGMTLSFSPGSDRGSRFVDIAYLRKSGRLVQ